LWNGWAADHHAALEIEPRKLTMTNTTQTLPAETAGTDITRFNALRHGVLSRYTVLPWESADEYRAVVEALVAEHGPQGPTEEHLVEEIAGILWRKRRLRLAEAAAHRRGLEGTLDSYRETVKVALVHLDTTGQSERVVDAIRATVADTDEDIAEMETDEAMTRRALDLLGSKRNDAYEAALAVLREDTQAWWADVLARDPDEMEEGEESATADAESLRRFLEGEVLPWFENRKKELANRPLIREQAFGEALDPDSWSGSVVTRCISTASSNECSPYCCGSRNCDVLPSRADPFGKSQTGCAGPSWPGRVLPSAHYS
jgi:hypothetical protein